MEAQNRPAHRVRLTVARDAVIPKPHRGESLAKSKTLPVCPCVFMKESIAIGEVQTRV